MKIVKEELTDTFIQFFVFVLSGYRDFIKNSIMDKDAFIAYHPEDIQPVSIFRCIHIDRFSNRLFSF